MIDFEFHEKTCMCIYIFYPFFLQILSKLYDGWRDKNFQIDVILKISCNWQIRLVVNPKTNFSSVEIFSFCFACLLLEKKLYPTYMYSSWVLTRLSKIKTLALLQRNYFCGTVLYWKCTSISETTWPFCFCLNLWGLFILVSVWTDTIIIFPGFTRGGGHWTV